jgi:hypothetical protein
MPTESVLARIARQKSLLTRAATPLAAAAALSALSSVAQAATTIYNLTPATSATFTFFDPLDGSFIVGAGGSLDSNNPIQLVACVSVRARYFSSLSGNFNFVGTSSFLSVLPSNTTIDSSTPFTSNSSTFTSPSPVTGETVYAGFRYTGQGAGFNETYYGWVEYVLDSNLAMTVNRFAIGGNNEAVITGIPEPASAVALLGTLALGTAGFLRRRRRNA